MRILVYGMGPLGSVFAARLAEAGHNVVALARGERLENLREYGIVLEDALTAERETWHVETIEKLEKDDSYDLILVVMRKNQALEILPTLAANESSPTVLFMMSNIGGFAELTEALGRERVMVGFPLPGGERHGHVMRIVPQVAGRPWELPIGEVDGRVTPRTRRMAAILESMRGYTVVIRTDMDAWLKYHSAGIIPLALALYAADLSTDRLARTPDAQVLGIRGLKEAFRGLRQMGIPPSPRAGQAVEWLPEPVLAPMVARFATMEPLQVSIVGHVRDARDEMRFLTEELLALLRSGNVDTPYLDQLYPYLDPKTPPIPDGSDLIGMNWRPIWLPAVALTAAVGVVAGVKYMQHHNGQKQKKAQSERV